VLERFKHQQEAIDMAKDREYMGLFWQAGTGKTRAAVEILTQRYKDEKKALRTLVLSPHVTLENWKEEFKKWAGTNHNVIALTKSGQRNKDMQKILDGDTLVNVIVVNYEALRSKDFYKKLFKWKPEVVLCDESHRIKNPKAQVTKQVLALSENTNLRLALTGTPMTNSPLDLFSQALFLDKGKHFGKNFFVFRATYMHDINESRKGLPKYFPMFKPRKSMFPKLTLGMKALGTKVDKSEVLDLPDLVRTQVRVELSPKQKKMYEEMKKDAVAQIENAKSSGVSVAPLAIVQALRLQQIVSGFITDDEGKVVEVDPGKTPPKYKAVKELVENYVDNCGEKVILWCCFKHDIKKLSTLFKDYKPAIIDGSTKDKQKEIKDFTGNETNLLIANRKAGGIGINLVESRVSIVVSRNHSYEDEIQSEARNYRSGSERHALVLKLDIVAKDTIDEDILKALGEKENMDKAIIGALSK
jgi:SNF2 family DNA or RNA helicase